METDHKNPIHSQKPFVSIGCAVIMSIVLMTLGIVVSIAVFTRAGMVLAFAAFSSAAYLGIGASLALCSYPEPEPIRCCRWAISMMGPIE
jgi:hypothetical protein